MTTKIQISDRISFNCLNHLLDNKEIEVPFILGHFEDNPNNLDYLYPFTHLRRLTIYLCVNKYLYVFDTSKRNKKYTYLKFINKLVDEDELDANYGKDFGMFINNRLDAFLSLINCETFVSIVEKPYTIKFSNDTYSDDFYNKSDWNNYETYFEEYYANHFEARDTKCNYLDNADQFYDDVADALKIDVTGKEVKEAFFSNSFDIDEVNHCVGYHVSSGNISLLLPPESFEDVDALPKYYQQLMIKNSDLSKKDTQYCFYHGSHSYQINLEYIKSLFQK